MNSAIRIKGDAQGVGFRMAIKQKADELGLTGFVKNEDDGCVYVEISAQGEKLDGFVTWCRIGTEGSKVTAVDSWQVDAEGEYEGFKILV